jgi:dephospho-CoA kinase
VERLNAIIHPRVRAEELKLLEAWRDRPLVVLDVPLLIEAGMRDMVDAVVVVTIGERERYGRLRLRGWSEAEVTRRLGMQMEQGRKRRLANYVVNNSGSLEETRRQVFEIMNQIKGAKQETT